MTNAWDSNTQLLKTLSVAHNNLLEEKNLSRNADKSAGKNKENLKILN